MTHPIHQPVVDTIHRALSIMDDLLRDRIELDLYSQKINELNVNDLLDTYQEDFKTNSQMVYYLDALMLLSSLQQELDFQVAEYGANVVSEDIKVLRELLDKFPRT